ncbi:MAG TPA: DNA topoisomerase IB [Jatrophihabitans sp.]|jgi:DNA topoisomerase-1|uniref:DNA topoisomerase IB n=1 Tax=Jatrophihabitans sp. TaxID=1932789 RepID=UPI002F183338
MPASPATAADPKAKPAGPGGGKKRAAKPADAAAAKPMSVAEVDELHADAQKCAEVAGLIYVAGEEPGMRRIRRGKGFSYLDHLQQPLTDAEVKARITQLAIPPAWQKVWICPNADGHILATGQDDKGRKQYIYHPKWRAIRDMLNFYRLILFANHLAEIREHTARQLRRRTFDRDRMLAAMIRVIDLTNIRIGNEVYAEENDSYGLTTLTRKHVRVSGDQVSFTFPAKSGKPWDDTINDPGVARVVQQLLTQRGRRLFSLDGKPVSSDELNQLLFSLTGEHITAKNFRTWGGTLAAFTYLKNRLDSERSAEKVVIEAIDEAAEALGNTRTVARAHYVHPHVLETYTEHTFGDYLAQAKPRPISGLHPDEQQLAAFLLELFEAEFSLLSTRS